MEYDFSGWATRNDLKCSDGRTIRKNAFQGNDGKTVPLVWNHQHNDLYNVLGHALLENRDEGVYAYCTLNESESGQAAKQLIQHGDIQALSIYANDLKQSGGDVLHGAIREVSLVLAGANPGAYIDTILSHADGSISDNEAVIYTGLPLELYHADSEDEDDEDEDKGEEKEEPKSESGETIGDVFKTLNQKQKDAVYAMIGLALQDKNKTDSKEDSEGGTTVKHNVFEGDGEQKENVLTHDAMNSIISDGKRYGSLKESFLQHADEYGITDIDYLFPDAQTLNKTPEFISRRMEWVQTVMGSVHHTPFSRIKSIFADITEDEARAKGYIKGNMKKEEVFGLLKRTTTPTTVYKKQKLDRDDVIDITDFDVVAWLKSEMRTMLDEELARAYLIGDGRSTSDDDKINESNIRPIWTDEDLYTIKYLIDAEATDDADTKAKAFIRGAIKSRKDYKGSGNPVLYTTEDMLTDCLLLEDGIGRIIYDTEEKLRTALRVSKIVTVPVMEDQTRTDDTNGEVQLLGIIVNLTDYNVGADKGGSVSMFDDFDIDYNQMKYLIETRCSGALTKPYSAIALEVAAASE